MEIRKKSQLHHNDIICLQVMVENKKNNPNDVLQKVMLHPKGVLLWFSRSIEIFQSRCQEDSLFGCYRQYHQKRKGSPPFYVHELIVRNPQKTCSPLPVAKYLTSDHITASVTYFLEALMTDVTRASGHKAMQSPVMLICDGSMALIAV